MACSKTFPFKPIEILEISIDCIRIAVDDEMLIETQNFAMVMIDAPPARTP